MMLEALLVIALLALHLSGLACLALAQDKHWQRLRIPRAPSSRTVFIGWAGLASSLALAWVDQGAAFGSLIWILLLPLNGYALALTLAWRPQWVRPLARLLGKL